MLNLFLVIIVNKTEVRVNEYQMNKVLIKKLCFMFVTFIWLRILIVSAILKFLLICVKIYTYYLNFFKYVINDKNNCFVFEQKLNYSRVNQRAAPEQAGGQSCLAERLHSPSWSRWNISAPETIGHISSH